MSIKSAWERSVLCSRTFPGKFCIFKKSGWQKVSFTSALPQALNISSAVSSTVTVTSLEKKCLGKKSAWDAASQHPAYYAGLLKPFLLKWRRTTAASIALFRFNTSLLHILGMLSICSILPSNPSPPPENAPKSAQPVASWGCKNRI